MKLGFIGGGNMAGAIAQGVIASGVFGASDICVCDINKEILEKYQKDVKTSVNNKDALLCDYIVLAVKPFILSKVFNIFIKHALLLLFY